VDDDFGARNAVGSSPNPQPAGGKTETAALLVFSRMLSENWRGLSVLYICPIKALLKGWATVASMCRAVYGEDLDPIEVRIRHSAPSCKGDHYGFFRCPVHFDSDASAILFSRADVDRRLPAANRELARANDKILADFLKKLRKDDLIARVKTAIAEEPPSGSPSDDVIAKSVFMSPRTLNRKLSALGTNYSQLLEAVRMNAQCPDTAPSGCPARSIITRSWS
jgi:AraC-like DNA-binding protein